MSKDLKTKYPEVIAFRLTRNEKREFDILMANMNTNKSEFLRKKVKRILKSITVKQ